MEVKAEVYIAERNKWLIPYLRKYEPSAPIDDRELIKRYPQFFIDSKHAFISMIGRGGLGQAAAAAAPPGR